MILFQRAQKAYDFLPIKVRNRLGRAGRLTPTAYHDRQTGNGEGVRREYPDRDASEGIVPRKTLDEETGNVERLEGNKERVVMAR